MLWDTERVTKKQEEGLGVEKVREPDEYRGRGHVRYMEAF